MDMSTNGTSVVPMKRVLIFGGKTGWIGGLMADLLKDKHRKYIEITVNLLFYALV